MSAARAAAQDLSGPGWRLALDPAAKWQNDALYLPDEVHLAKLPVNPPTGGWDSLGGSTGIPVTLPSTVEEHYWGKLGMRDYANGEYLYERSDKTVQNGSYDGVSWWYRTFTAPPVPGDHRLLLHIRGQRLRAEVYVNHQLCGYSILTECPVTADITSAVKPGPGNLLAIRITNPGGRWDWDDPRLDLHWGNYPLPSSIGAGGLDGGVEMELVNRTAVSDLAVLNRLDPRSVRLLATVQTDRDYNGAVIFSISRAGKKIWSKSTPVTLKAGASHEIPIDATVPDARIWTLDDPEMYTVWAVLMGEVDSGGVRQFGFRTFTAADIGSNARLMFNGKRMVVRSAISWGFWAPNGIWPTQDAADREVDSAKALGLNCIQSHRNLSKPLVLDTQDRRGLLRYEEPGAGFNALGDTFSLKADSPKGPIDTSGAGADATTFIQRYEEAKILTMVRRDRSHPSLAMYCIQNEIEPDLHNPRVFRILREVHAVDPSRIVVLHSGIAARDEAFMLPWDDTVYHDDGTGYSGWRDEHTVGGPGTYMDNLYTSPQKWSHASDDRKQIVMWGETLGVGTPDDHQRIAADYQTTGAVGYDRDDHERIDAAYTRFLDKYGFRSAFPTNSDLYRSINANAYWFWQKLTENCRMSDPVDYMVISGWESTSIENHSGIVDSHRFLKGDASIIKQAQAPLLLVIRPRHFVLAPGDEAVVDLFLVNEVNERGVYQLAFTATDADGRNIFTSSQAVDVQGGDVYGQYLPSGFAFKVPTSGTVKLTATLSHKPYVASRRDLPPAAGARPVVSREQDLAVIDENPSPLPGRVVVFDSDHLIAPVMRQAFGVNALDASALDAPALARERVDAVVIAPTSWMDYRMISANPTVADEPPLYVSQFSGKTGVAGVFGGLARGRCKVELFFNDAWASAAGRRVFDVALNGKTVLSGFDIFVAAGGRDRGIVKSFDVDAPDGTVELSVAKIETPGNGTGAEASFAAVRITDSAGRVVRVTGAATPYTDVHGNVWAPYTVSRDLPTAAQMDRILERVHDDGARLVFWPHNLPQAEDLCRVLAARQILTIGDSVGPRRASWMGAWYFVRSHPLFAGLPTDRAFDWHYQVPVGGAEGGLNIDAPGMQAVVGYGRDHDTHLGIGAAVVPYGKGKIVIFSIPTLNAALQGKSDAMCKPTAVRILYNALGLE